MKFAFSPIAIVVDIEALDLCATAKIGTIGAAAVNVATGQRLGTFYQRIDLSLDQPGRTTEKSTLEFWAEQEGKNPAAWRELFEPSLSRGTLREALEALAAFIGSVAAGGRAVEVVGNGPEYDNVILADAFKQAEIRIPWPFRANQSLRTAVWMGRLLLGIDPKYQTPRSGIEHHALFDAIHEAEYLMAIIGKFIEALGLARAKRGYWLKYGGKAVELRSFLSGVLFAVVPLALVYLFHFTTY